MAKIRIPLQEWSWRMANPNSNAKADGIPGIKDWTPVSSFPSVIHMELLAKQLIENPNIAENERVMQWVGMVDWEYQAVFTTPSELLGKEQTDLVFEGLDTFATVYMNEVEILKSTNMFIPARVPVTLARNVENRLRIVFESAYMVGASLNDKHGVRWSRMRNPKRNHTRKAQYSWGWDWGPTVLTAGPYLPVYLEAYSARIGNVYVRSTLGADYSSAAVSVATKTVGAAQGTSIMVRVVDADGAEICAESKMLGSVQEGLVEFSVQPPKLWWPNGLGLQHLYTAQVTLLDSHSKILDQTSTRFGIRQIELVQKTLDEKPGKTFMFRVNGRELFAQGVNWIPADNLLPTISRQRYFDWIRMVHFANMNMIRVWGGGVYETDDFFDACDEMGVLVWHDYAFACGDYPLHDEFIDSIAREAEVQTVKMRNRASLALLCGGNEDFLMYDWLKRGPDYNHEDLDGPFEGQPFPQRKIFLSVLAGVAGDLCPSVAYWPSSPWGGPQVNDLTIGDVHQWEVWHLSQMPYQDYPKIGGRFVSEFGMQAYPVHRTVEHFLRGSDPREHHPLSRVIDCHNKCRSGSTRLARYVAENIRVGHSSLPDFAYATHLVQAEAYSYAFRGWKRQFRGFGREECAGALIWQLNDVYPGISWSIVDYFIRPKPAFYAVRRACAPVGVGVERSPASRCVDENAPMEGPPAFEVFAHNSTCDEIRCLLELRAYDMATGTWTDLPEINAKREVMLQAGYSSELGTLAAQPSWTADTLIVLEATLWDPVSSRCLARVVDWPEPFRYLCWPEDTQLSIKTESLTDGEEVPGYGVWENKVCVVASQPLKGVWLEPVYDGSEKEDSPEPLWEDNMVDLMPGQELSLQVQGLKGRKVHARFLADWEIARTEQ